MDKIITAVQNTINKKSNSIIAIDGPCASGKTTLAKLIAENTGAQIIHMDNFFLPPEMRTAKRLSQAGGNIHYERFNAEVTKGIESCKEFVYGAFSCKEGAIISTINISPHKPVIVEGSYALHPKIGLQYDLKIFVEADYETRLERILCRNGKDALEIFKTKWIPLEDKYFREFEIRSNCDVIRKTDREK